MEGVRKPWLGILARLFQFLKVSREGKSPASPPPPRSKCHQESLQRCLVKLRPGLSLAQCGFSYILCPHSHPFASDLLGIQSRESRVSREALCVLGSVARLSCCLRPSFCSLLRLLVLASSGSPAQVRQGPGAVPPACLRCPKTWACLWSWVCPPKGSRESQASSDGIHVPPCRLSKSP